MKFFYAYIFSIFFLSNGLAQILGSSNPCADVDISYSISGTGITNINWSASGNGLIVSGGNSKNVIVRWTAAGTGSVEVSYFKGLNQYGEPKEFVFSKSVSIQKPVSNIIALGSTSICDGQSLTLQNSVSSNSYSYQWRLNGNLISGATASSLQVTQAGLYQLLVTENACQSLSSSVTIYLKPLPSISISSSSQIICSGSSMTPVTFSNPNNIAGTVYNWSVSSPSVSGTIAGSSSSLSQTLHQTTSVNQIATYTITPTANGCNGQPATHIVTVKPIPTIAVSSGAQTICSGQSISPVTFSNPNGIIGTTYSWTVLSPDIIGATSGSGSSLGQTLSQNTSTNKASTYTITPTANGCPGNPITHTVTVKPIPTVAVSSPSQTICSGQQMVNVDIFNPNGVSGTTYNWSVFAPNITGANGGSTTTIAQILSQSTSTNQTATYSIIPIANNCSGPTLTHTVTVNANSSGGTVSSNAEAYGTANGVLSLTGNNGTVQNWQQKIGNAGWTDISNNSASQLYSITNTTRYRAVVKNGVCPTAYSTEAEVIVYPIPAISINGLTAIAPASATQLGFQSGFYFYQWYKNSVAIAGANAATLLVTQPGLYKVTFKSSSNSPIYATEEVDIKRTLDVPLQDMNYVRSTTFAVSGVNEATDVYQLNPKDYAISTTYFDGLGRPVQSVALGAAGNGNDLITPIEYDAFGREAKKYLPYAHASRDGRYQPTALTSQGIFYNNASDKVADDIAPYSQAIFEPSPLNRVIKQGAPGLDWQPNTDNTYNASDHSVKFSYEFNQANEVLRWAFTYPTEAYTTTALNAFGKVEAGTATAPVFYPANQLYKNKTKDEQGNQVIEYVDKEGRTVLKRVQVVTGNPSTTDTNRDTNWASTYYIYDDFGNLVCVIPPEPSKLLGTQYFQLGSTEDSKNKFLKRWAFRYRYDERKRMIMKQVPGAEPVYMVYDERDRLVMTQDGNQRTQNRWSFTKYDALNRPVITGIYTHNTLQTQQQMNANISTTSFAEVLDTNQPHGYTTAIFPNTNLTVHSVTFYDNYNFTLPDVGLNFATAHLTGQESVANTSRVRGLVTATKVNILNSTDYLWTVTFYDNKYRPIQIVAQNHVGGITRTTNKYDFVKLVQTKTTTATSTATVNTQRSLFYDAAGRLTETWHRVNTQDSILLAKNEYNELGQLIDKKLHSTAASGSNARQSIDYRYNIRGWLTSANNAKLNIDANNDDVNDLFGMELGYNNSLGVGNASLYNGNISAIKWSNNTIESDVLQKAYVFSYDALNRLKSANEKKALTFTTWLTGDFHERGLEYDLNGNITRLNRTAENGVVTDSLIYEYGTTDQASNKLLYVNDASGNSQGFNNVNTGLDDYSYDANGNLTVDKNKQITKIAYNHLNLPAMVKKGTADSIRYVYDASGIKLSQQVLGSQAKITHYVGELVLENGSIQMLQHEEGRLVPDGSHWEYQYHVKDHLGNVRTTFGTKELKETKKATLENNNQAADYANFLRVAEARRVQSHLFDRSNGVAPATTSGYAQRLNATANERFGLAKSISVMPGDTIRAEVYAKYIDTNNANWTTFLNTLLSQIAAGTATPGTVVDGGSYGSSTNSFTYNPNALTEKQNSSETGPKAYLNWLVFKRDGTLILNKSGFDRLSAIPKEHGQDVAHERLYSPDIIIDEPGFIYLYLSNEEATPLEVYFDDFTVSHTMKNPVIQSDDYYPFGMTFNSYSRENSLTNQYLYNGKEKQDELDLGWYDYIARQYDPLIGRFISIDPAADLMRRISPYAYAFNNPIRFTDPDGMVPGDFLNEKGEKIGTDGINDGKVYVIKTTQSEFDSGVPSAGISKQEAKQTEAYIKSASGIPEFFDTGSLPMQNTVEIEGSSATRQAMVNEVNQDNGKGGTSDANNREYGGETSVAGLFTPAPPGPIADPITDPNAHINIPNWGEDTKSDTHSHPSGTKSVNNGDGTTTNGSFRQAPSPDDVANSGANSNYVFGRGNGTVYIYNNTGVQATIPQKYFVNPKEK